jgi:hypothetical protein
MMFDPYLVQLAAEESMEDLLREVERVQLIRAAKGPRKLRGWRLLVALILSSLLALFMRPQSQSLT